MELNDEADGEECELCGQCWKDGVSDQKRPKYSIANDVDYGVLHRGLSDQQRRRFGKLTYVEKLCISLYRLYLHVLKLTPAGSGVRQSGLVGHTISFPQDEPVSVLSSEPTNVHGTEVRPLRRLP